MSIVHQILENAGLDDKESQVYLGLLEMGEMPVSRIAVKTGLKRSTTYTIVESLKLKGLVSVNTKRSILYVSPVSPLVFLDKLKSNLKMFEDIVPELVKMAYASPLKPRIRFFEGSEGLKQVLREFSHSKVQSMGFTDYGDMPPELLAFIRTEVIPERRRNKNKAMLIVPDNEQNREVHSRDDEFYTQHKIVKFYSEKNPIELLLFGNSEVAFLSYAKDELFSVVLDSKAIYLTLKNIFTLIWHLH